MLAYYTLKIGKKSVSFAIFEILEIYWAILFRKDFNYGIGVPKYGKLIQSKWFNCLSDTFLPLNHLSKF